MCQVRLKILMHTDRSREKKTQQKRFSCIKLGSVLYKLNEVKLCNFFKVFSITVLKETFWNSEITRGWVFFMCCLVLGVLCFQGAWKLSSYKNNNRDSFFNQLNFCNFFLFQSVLFSFTALIIRFNLFWMLIPYYLC